MNVLGVLFDSKLNWSDQVSSAILKANKSLNAIKLIRKFFSTPELLQLVTSNFYSVLYYNSEIWNSPHLSYSSKQSLMSASGKALRVCLHFRVPNVSFVDLHKIIKRASPNNVGIYKISLQLYKTFNLQLPEKEWVNLNWQQTSTTRQTTLKIIKNNNYRVGLNCQTNKFHVLNDIIPLLWLNKSWNSFKIDCKKLLLSG